MKQGQNWNNDFASSSNTAYIPMPEHKPWASQPYEEVSDTTSFMKKRRTYFEKDINKYWSGTPSHSIPASKKTVSILDD